MIDFTGIESVPQNLILNIFLVGFFAGFLVTVVVILLFKSGGRRREQSGETPHDIIMAIKRKANAESSPLSIMGIFSFLLAIIFLFALVTGIIVIGRYLTEGAPKEEAFVPFAIRIFLIPLMDKFPILREFLTS